ncbi:MAG: L-histidine N(alpha)-methyltransferase [Gemmatimonadales bacterium]|nr:MAG: L-histidine N(alpha)-methyltransferase [Gemmatimonadales bacterium]
MTGPVSPSREARVRIMVREEEEIREEVRTTLSGSPRSLPCRFFYDAEGARLFEEITRLEEYYPTRAETEILGGCAAEVARVVGPRARMVEFGSGSGEKTWLVLDELESPSAYVPVDIAREQLVEFAARVRRRLPGLEVLPVVTDYTRLSELPWPETEAGATLAFFPGSTVGNLDPEDARTFLARVARSLGSGEFFLIGVDLVKDPDRLERAYNDARGVTAAFNLNILRHLNTRLGSDFDPDGFRHRAIWNAEHSRIEMHLVSQRDQVVSLGPRAAHGRPSALEIVFGEGEVIVTEYSYKYGLDDFRTVAREAGYGTVSAWTDARGDFSVHLLEVR